MRRLVQTQKPVASLYRGLTPNLLGNATSWASFFFFKSWVERGITALKSGTGVLTTGARAALTPVDYFVSSGLAGMLTQAITNPIWVLKTRMISSDRSAAGAYPSTWAGATALFREEGIWGFYKGLGVGFLSVSHGAVQFAVYEPAKRMYSARRWHLLRPADRLGSSDRAGRDEKRITNEATLVISTLSKLVAGAVTYPFQVIRSRLQNYNSEEQFGRGIRGVVFQLWREEGLRGFYRGLMPGVVRVLPATWVTFLVYENVKHYLPRWVSATSATE
jgi:solute carrier family 25 folate transporter 32